MNTIILSLGSNIGELKENIDNTIKLIAEKCNIIKVSSFIKTKPMEFEDQPDFLNCALKAETSLTPNKLLEFLKTVEKISGRKKTFRYGPRKIDIDIIFYNNDIVFEKDLIIPHEKAHLREFVLKPISEIDANYIHPILKKNIIELLENLK